MLASIYTRRYSPLQFNNIGRYSGRNNPPVNRIPRKTLQQVFDREEGLQGVLEGLLIVRRMVSWLSLFQGVELITKIHGTF